MFIDTHCHILPGIDDGAADISDSLEMAKALVDCGFSKVVATPHAWPQLPGPEAAAAGCARLAARLEQEKIALLVYPGAENRLTAEFMQDELEGKGRHLSRTNYVLLETPYETSVPALADLLFRLRSKKIRPVIAHPERCAQFADEEQAAEAVRVGATLQLDVGSLIGRYGRQARKVASRLLQAGLYSVAATDLHQANGASRWIEKALRHLERTVGQAQMNRLLAANPARILANEEIL